MSVKPTRLANFSIADTTLTIPVYYSVKQIQSLRVVGEQTHRDSSHVGDSAFSQFIPTGDKVFSISLRGFSDNASADMLLSSGFSDNALRLVRLDTPQGQRISGQFWVIRFIRDMQVGQFDEMEAELRSHGTISVATL